MSSEHERELLARIALRQSLPRHAARRLLEAFGSARRAFAAPASELRARFAPALAQRIGQGADWGAAGRELERALRGEMRCLLPEDAEFPPALRRIPDPPLLLYVRGSLPPGPALAIVGSRKASERTRERTRRWAADLAARGVVVVSGLAYGVDAAAHLGALDGGGRTLAVLASGLDRPSPRGNRRLAERILDQAGAWLSEQPPGQVSLPHQFPERNRLISGLAQASLIVEARVASGTLWTARHALEQGREVLVVPGPVETPGCRGSNELLRDGATPVLDEADLRYAVLGEAGSEPAPRPPADPLLAALENGPRDADELGRELRLAPAELSARLLKMELAGRIERRGSRVALVPGGSATL